MRRLAASLLAGLVLASGCKYVDVSFGRRLTPGEEALEAEVRSYYNEVQLAFAAGDAVALSALFAPEISKPMTRPQILDWGVKFFKEHGKARFVVEKLDLEELGWGRAVTRLAYRVATADGKGDFGGVEIDTLARRNGRWLITEWEKVAKP